MMNKKLKFGRGNAKIGEHIHTFSLPAGHSCPGALHCLAKADRRSGRITDGPQQQYRCFAASMEWRSSIRDARWHNFESLRKSKSTKAMSKLILDSLPTTAKIVRVHVSGDFFSEAYFLAWLKVAVERKSIRFYAYTKSIPLWVQFRDWIPSNFHLTASLGGKHDGLVEEFELKTAKVVFSLEEAAALGLEVDHDDSHAYDGKASFGLLIHGQQKAGSAASKAVRELDGLGSYSSQAKTF